MNPSIHFLNVVQDLTTNGIPQWNIPPVEDVRAVYAEALPDDALVPCLLLEPVEIRMDFAAKALIHVVEQVRVTAICPEHAGRLGIYWQVLALFHRGYIPVNSRTIHTDAGLESKDPDEPHVTVTAEYYRWLGERDAPEPPMEHIDSQITLKG